jgi:hypothetical protein
MEQYSTRHLSVRTDKLPALSALAAAFMDILRAANIEDTYLAGLWKNDLAYGLLWIAKKSGTPSKLQNSPYIAPSWSWASLEVAQIKFPEHAMGRRDDGWRRLDSFHVVEVICKTQGENPYGRIAGGFLTVRTGIMEASVYDPKYEKPISADSFKDDSLRGWRNWLGLVGVESGLVVGMIRLDEQDEPEGPVLCVPVLARREYPSQVQARIELYNDLLSASVGEPETTRHHNQKNGEMLKRMKYPHYRSMMEVYANYRHVDEDEYKSFYMREKRKLYQCLVVVCSGSETYRRVGIADIWDLEWFDDALARTVTIV